MAKNCSRCGAILNDIQPECPHCRNSNYETLKKQGKIPKGCVVLLAITFLQAFAIGFVVWIV